MLKKPDFREQTSVWHTNRRNQEVLEVTVGLDVSDSIMGGMAAPPVRVAPDRRRRRGAVLAVNRCDLDADSIQSKLPTSRTGRASRTRSEPNRSRNRPFDPVVLCIFGRIGPFDATSSGGAMPTTTQLCVCRASARTDLWPEHSSTISTCSTRCRYSGDAFIFARNAPSDANRSL